MELPTGGQLNDLKKIAETQKDDGNLLKFCRNIVENRSDTSGVEPYRDLTLLGQEHWRIFSKIKNPNWTMVWIYYKNDIKLKSHELLANKLLLIFFIWLLLICTTYIFYQCIPSSFLKFKHISITKNIWIFSHAVSIYSILILIWIIFEVDLHTPYVEKEKNNTRYTQIINYSGAIGYLDKKFGIYPKLLTLTEDSILKLRSASHYQKNIKDPQNELFQLHLNINAIELIESNYFQIAGEIRVKHPKRDSKIDQQVISPPFYFPDAVVQEYSLLDESIKRERKRLQGDSELDTFKISDWKFSCKVHQGFIYNKYPFDYKRFKLRISHIDRSKEFFIPDFDTYFNNVKYILNKSLDEKELLLAERKKQGLKGNIIIPDWKIKSASFNIGETDNISIISNKDSATLPELVYVLEAKRILTEPLIANILPIYVISLIIYLILLQMKDLKMGGVIGTVVALFFSLLLSHYKLRDDLQFNSLVFIEFYYFILYVALIISVFNKYYYLSKSRNYAIIDYKDNLIAKVTYWPTLLSMVIVFTICYFLYP
ncbi:hypothetical protein [Carboxylicivirga sp. RSCT41]|uniref:hypothetical protein n=1 Tax=Carboxylicivirga agarovorans TaxID=3417570 RepID=UPI003D32AAA8